ncbi:MAG: S26 family signal peptidase, partial [Planctomycetota bacterium]
CGIRYQVGASGESSGQITNIESVCPNCKHRNALDLKNNPDHDTFNGDRILVSKCAYLFQDPRRWDVFVFKFVGNPKQNFIKRLVGLPGEILRIRHGDVYRKPLGKDEPFDAAKDDAGLADNGYEILRKPPHIQLAMRHRVYDSNHQPVSLLDAGFPSRLQPWELKASSPDTLNADAKHWSVQRSESGLQATLPADSAQAGTRWMRYFHHVATHDQWQTARRGGSLANTAKYKSRTITDFNAYDTYVTVERPSIYQSEFQPLGFSRSMSTPVFNPNYQTGVGVNQFGEFTPDMIDVRSPFFGYSADGVGEHWVGDLMCEVDLQTGSDAKSATLEIVESGI